MTRPPEVAEEHEEGHAKEELLRVVLGRITPHASPTVIRQATEILATAAVSR